ncbi:Aste57867_8139 [Aphanomyces stellatus]|uniref:Aste57867_8139 protein n=1 Tax=Aphanomyces stellatus TaxID=120398 RepID=A0A485KJG4_9STRA|nr:hypothetical protein As57867_008109 [Aphanomyces stellatus]VFT85028.1 Aste57867_8139 [Aphanomyces stellatus]
MQPSAHHHLHLHSHHHRVKSVVAVEEPGWLNLGKKFRDRHWNLSKHSLIMSTDKRGEHETVTITHGRVWHSKGVKFGIQVDTQDGRCIRAQAHSKSQWAAWLQAFHDLRPASATPKSPARVQFHDHVRVRSIPIQEDDDDCNDSCNSRTSESSDEDDEWVKAL